MSQLPPEKVVFLDVDGVVNTHFTTETVRYLGMLDLTGVEERLCLIVERIFKETGAALVLSSSWREMPELLPYLWKKLGPVTHGRLYSRTQIPSIPATEDMVLMKSPRADEIANWLAANPSVKKFAIIDDDISPSRWGSSYFQTDMREGITEELANKVIKHLNSDVAFSLPPKYKPIETAPTDKLLSVVWGSNYLEFGVAKNAHGKWWNYTSTNPHAQGRVCSAPIGWTGEFVL